MSKKEENLFLENQKIPETLDMYFKNYVQKGDYGMLIDITRDYISRDTGNVDIIIHNLKLEKEQIEINIHTKEVSFLPIGISIATNGIAIIIKYVVDITSGKFESVGEYLITPIIYGICCFLIYNLCKFIVNTIKEDDFTSLREKEKLNFLDFCIEEYNKKKQQ